MEKLALALLLLALALPAAAQDAGWKDQQGRPLPNTESRQSVGDFGGWVLVTPDSDWQAKWATPADTAPHFREANAVARDGQVFVLIFIANPGFSGSGGADVTCDLAVVRPDGSYSVNQPNAECLRTNLQGPANHVYLAAPVIGFVGASSDPLGAWVIRVVLRDNVRKTNVSLKTSFTLNE